MFNFIHDFLSDTSFKVKNNNFLSPPFRQQNGVPERSSLSVHSNIDLSQHSKSETKNKTLRNLYHSLMENYQDYTRFYNDGTKTRASVFFNNTSKIKIIELPNFCSTYTTESYTISHSHEIIKQQTYNN